MADVHRLHIGDSTGEGSLVTESATVSRLESARCALCGRSLVKEPVRYHMVSPLVSMGPVTVCRACRRVALSEGYLPAD